LLVLRALVPDKDVCGPVEVCGPDNIHFRRVLNGVNDAQNALVFQSQNRYRTFANRTGNDMPHANLASAVQMTETPVEFVIDSDDLDRAIILVEIVGAYFETVERDLPLRRMAKGDIFGIHRMNLSKNPLGTDFYSDRVECSPRVSL
jgi:hypothetical protein